ncbi:hypothetical protein FRX31_010166 [Thalictrum thalictroides]|uniref:Uncharacterized protein n=1 Tax=Thalictrum thalictroides TaxID=46969 RepID=A0A7J6WSA0_THATH|nr:hypothetical protein FRX31_010166 [Thalictrum thalictroides]
MNEVTSHTYQQDRSFQCRIGSKMIKYNGRYPTQKKNLHAFSSAYITGHRMTSSPVKLFLDVITREEELHHHEQTKNIHVGKMINAKKNNSKNLHPQLTSTVNI